MPTKEIFCQPKKKHKQNCTGTKNKHQFKNASSDNLGFSETGILKTKNGKKKCKTRAKSSLGLKYGNEVVKCIFMSTN